MTNPGGTGRPARAISPRFAPLPPATDTEVRSSSSNHRTYCIVIPPDTSLFEERVKTAGMCTAIAAHPHRSDPESASIAGQADLDVVDHGGHVFDATGRVFGGQALSVGADESRQGDDTVENGDTDKILFHLGVRSELLQYRLSNLRVGMCLHVNVPPYPDHAEQVWCSVITRLSSRQSGALPIPAHASESEHERERLLLSLRMVSPTLHPGGLPVPDHPHARDE